MSMTDTLADPHLKEVLADIKQEHQQIFALLDQLKQPCTLDRLRLLLAELHSTLMSHFAHEQYPGGLYEYLGNRHPEHHPVLRQLVDDHNFIISTVRGLLERVQLGDPQSVAGVAQEVAGLAERIQTHELRERELAKQGGTTA
ncbi:MAG: hemerythrin domain-containing protein [Gammaproteobacteria bacterium]